MPTVEFNDDTLALNYIRERGYASYSSMKNVRDCVEPSPFFETPALIFGKELHSRWLENKKLKTLSAAEEAQLRKMLARLNSSPIAKRLRKGAITEEQFDQEYKGLRVLGYIDINGVSDVADLKTTRIKNKRAFVNSMDFLQAALYLRVTQKTNFFYIGICKEEPYDLMIFNVWEYPARMKAAFMELDRLVKYIKRKL